MAMWQRGVAFGAIALLLVGLPRTDVGRTLDDRGLDLLQRPHAPHPDIVILAIDQQSIAELGRWPWPRNTHARLLERLQEVAPAAVGYDVTFTTPSDQGGDVALARSLEQVTFPVVLATDAVYTRGRDTPQRLAVPLPMFTEHPTVAVGHVNIPVSPDGLARRVPEVISVAGERALPWSVQLARALHADAPAAPGFVNFAGPTGTFPTVPVHEVLADRVPREALAGKIILIGATVSDLHDTVLVPGTSPVMAGVEWQANALDNLLLRRAVTEGAPAIPRGIGLGIGALAVTVLSRFRPRALVLSLVILGTILPVGSALAWRRGIAVPYAVNLLGVAGIATAFGFTRWSTAEAEKRRLRRTIQQYFSPAVLAAILRDPKSLRLGGQRREVTVLFADIRGFTTLSEALPPEPLTALLQETFTALTAEIFATDGVVDKFIGDAIMAFWGAPLTQPDHADRAVAAARGMVRRLADLRTHSKKRGDPLLDIGIGINTGVATVGNMGSATRFDYTVIGDTVNVASRLESLTKEVGHRLLISAATKEKLAHPVPCRSLGAHAVKGRAAPVEVFAVEQT